MSRQLTIVAELRNILGRMTNKSPTERYNYFIFIPVIVSYRNVYSPSNDEFVSGKLSHRAAPPKRRARTPQISRTSFADSLADSEYVFLFFLK